jgi:hypothetical protein
MILALPGLLFFVVGMACYETYHNNMKSYVLWGVGAACFLPAFLRLFTIAVLG